jgi:hypothetical protein
MSQPSRSFKATATNFRTFRFECETAPAAQARFHHHRGPRDGGDQAIAGKKPVPGRADTWRVFGD